MAKCVVCGKMLLMSNDIGNAKLCNGCAGKINFNAWKKRDFDSMDDLVNKKTNALQLALISQFSEDVVKIIARYFDEYITDGYITMLNGKMGQKIKVFSEYCTIDTKESSQSSIASSLGHMLPDECNERDMTTAQKKNVVDGLLSGKIIQTGIGLATTTIFNNAEKEKEEERIHKKLLNLVIPGEFKINYREMKVVELDICGGYIRFVPHGVDAGDYYGCKYFVFNSSSPLDSKKIKKKANDVVNNIRERMSKILYESQMNYAQYSMQMPHVNTMPMTQMNYNQQMVQAQMPVVQPINMGQQNNVAQNSMLISPININQRNQNNAQNDSFEEIRKYKALFDEGIISEEEFNQKKKQLLGL